MKEYTLKDGTVLAYDEIGTGRPVLFLPGWASERKAAFGHILPVIGKEYRAICYDQRGSGETSPSRTRPVTVEMLVDDIHEVLRGLNLKDCTVVGHSMGGSEMMYYVDKYGCDEEYIHSIVLIDISPRTTKDPDDPLWTLGMYRGEHTLEGGLRDYEVMKTDFRKWYETLVCASRPYMKEVPREEFNTFIDQCLKNFKQDEQVELYLSTLYVDVRSSLPKFTVPTAYFYADPGSLYFPELANYYGEKIANASYTPVSFASNTHAFPVQMAEQFCESLLEFLKQ